MYSLKVKKIPALLVLLAVFAFVPNKKIIAQNQIISLEIEVSDVLSN